MASLLVGPNPIEPTRLKGTSSTVCSKVLVFLSLLDNCLPFGLAKPTAVVIGGTGATGRHVVQRLLNRGHRWSEVRLLRCEGFRGGRLVHANINRVVL